METINFITRIEYISRIFNTSRPKIFKQKIDPFTLPDTEFKKMYRISKQTVKKITSLVKTDILLDSRGRGTSAELQVLVALCSWGRREMQDNAGDIHGLSQATVSRICARVSRALVKLAKDKIKMPASVEEEVRISKKFKEIHNFPGIIGAIDGTHIKIKKTGGEMAQYYINRKGFYSLNVQVICDAELRIQDIVARWRGSTHDCRIFNESKIKERFQNKEFKGRLLGDSGYKLTPYLFTPILRPKNAKEVSYNIAHIATRNTVEQCFGVWKQRFRCLLDGMTISFKNMEAVVMALAVLHNIAIDEKDSLPDDISLEEEMAGELSNYGGTTGQRENLILRSFIEKYF